MGDCSTYRGMRGSYWVLVWKLKRKRPLGRHWRKKEYNIKMNFHELICEGMDCINLAQDRDR
jgi:hypothetical protein